MPRALAGGASERTKSARRVEPILDITIRIAERSSTSDPHGGVPGEMAIYKRGERWHVQVDLPDRGDGKRHRRARTFRTEREAKQQEAQWVTERAAGTNVDPSRMTVGALLATCLETIEPNVKRKTFVGYEHTVHHHLIPALGHRKLQTLTSINVHDAYTAKRKANTGARTLQLM